MTDCKSKFLPAHAHRHEWHSKIVVCQMNRIHGFRVKFLSSPGFPGLGFGTVILNFRIGCQGFTEPNLSPLLNKNQTPFSRKEYLICGGKGKNDFWKCKKYLTSYFIIPTQAHSLEGVSLIPPCNFQMLTLTLHLP
jgi:hypothetical protein